MKDEIRKILEDLYSPVIDALCEAARNAAKEGRGEIKYTLPFDGNLSCFGVMLRNSPIAELTYSIEESENDFTNYVWVRWYDVLNNSHQN